MTRLAWPERVFPWIERAAIILLVPGLIALGLLLLGLSRPLTCP